MLPQINAIPQTLINRFSFNSLCSFLVERYNNMSLSYHETVMTQVRDNTNADLDAVSQVTCSDAFVYFSQNLLPNLHQ